ncbi:response regulator transcription factor [Tessaracoccus antarcticus]|uniref:DNA-binding response regulator n=1 Tax=Tessaracoccus antarcticus TaxID=2479848 RepID=A0A3M0FYF9_9ACTN|nr:response regulator transcription factor [Tessaracoccus antarcticus]RMB57780.1 DNA-binding response regulator [Tessaracoccus antarcticus]
MTDPLRVLVAEDDPDIRDVVAFKLGRAGFDVTAVEDGTRAAHELFGGSYAVAILDVMMPGLSGLDVLASYRASVPEGRTRILLLTARARDVDVDSGFAAGADDYVIKPFLPRELVSRVTALAGRA